MTAVVRLRLEEAYDEAPTLGCDVTVVLGFANRGTKQEDEEEVGGQVILPRRIAGQQLAVGPGGEGRHAADECCHGHVVGEVADQDY